MPALEGHRRLAAFRGKEPHDAVGVACELLRVGVEETRGAVAAHRDPPAEALELIGLEPARGEPLDELRAVALVVEVDRDAPVLGHARIPADPRAGSSAISAGDAGRGFAFARRAGRLGDARLGSGRRGRVATLEAGQAGQLLGFARGVVRLPIASPKRATSAAATGSVKRSAGGRRPRWRHRARSVAAAERLGHRVAEPEARSGECRAGVHGPLEQLPPSLDVGPVASTRGSEDEISRAPVRASLSASGFRPVT